MFINKILNKFDNHTSCIVSSALLNYKVGELVNVGIRVCEGEKVRIQNYRGLIISKKYGSPNSSVRIRKIFQKIGIEKIFPLQTFQITRIKSIKQYHFKRSKLYYLRSNLKQSSMIK